MGKQRLPLTGLSFILNDNFYVESSDTRMDFLKTGKPCVALLAITCHQHLHPARAM